MANSWSDSISEIDTAALAVVRTLPAGFEPNSVITDLAGRFLYVANRISNDISMVDLSTGAEVKRLAAGRGASYLARSPDGASIYCTHIYPYPGKFRTPPESDIAVIDTARQTVKERYRLPNAAGVFHVAMSADGRLGMAAQLRPKNLIPLAHVEHGWVFGNSISVFGADVAGEVVQLPLDELDRYFTPPFAIAMAPDKSVGVHFDHGLRQRDRDRHCQDAGVHPRGDSGTTPHPGQRSLGLGELRGQRGFRSGPLPRASRSLPTGSACTWRIGRTTPSP